MKCFLCKGSLEDKNSTFMVELDNIIVIIKDVPSQVCSQCGEASYSNAVSERIEQIVKSVVSISATEIAVVHYSKAA
jgi:YgiT-type zinc finger domain-containing protein